MENSHAIAFFLVITIVVIALVVAIYYMSELRAGRTLTTSQYDWIRGFLVVVAIIAFISWLWALWIYFKRRNHHHDHDHFYPENDINAQYMLQY